MERIISPVAIDLGAKNTGLLLTQYVAGEAIGSEHSQAVTLVVPDEKSGLTLSQQARTVTRHRLRADKRRKMAKRLLKLTVQSVLDKAHAPLSETQWQPAWEALSRLLNRRGYNRLTSELDESALRSCDLHWFANALPDFFTTDASLLDQWDQLIQTPSRLRLLAEHPLLQLKEAELKKQALAEYDKDEKKSICSAVKTIREGVNSLLQELDFGHKHRTEYLEAIRAEIKRDTRLHALTAVVSEDALWRLVGNISNLQLRCARWYFNHRAMREEDLWQPDRLQHVLVRWLQYWRPESSEEKARRKEALECLRGSTDVLAALMQLDPHYSIPPYEDQDNRRPPKDQTLWLNPLALDASYGGRWVIWAQNLLRANPGWDDGVDRILSHYDRKSRLPQERNGQREEPAVTVDQLKNSYLLQRLLDRSSLLDPYALRKLARGRDTHSIFANREKLSQDLGSQHLEQFLGFCQHYYAEVELSRQGVWRADKHTLLERSNLNPPQKKKILNCLVGAVLGEELTAQGLAEFRQHLWSARSLGRSTLKGACATIEESRKDSGNLFNKRLHRLRYLVETLAEDKKKLKGTDKEVWTAWEKTLQAAEVIANYFGHSATQKQRYADPFSMSQLYNLLERDRSGFSSTTLAAHLENSWRTEKQKVEGKPGEEAKQAARCSRLPADCVRPFDGVLRRLLQRQAWEIAQLKAQQIKTAGLEKQIIEIPILIEENRFAYSEGLLDLKKAGATKRKKLTERLQRQERKKLTERLQRQEERWLEKDERIRKASKGVCPYTGEALGVQGELDHILPRSATKASKGTVYNSEANLIWCSRRGNQEKAAKRYLLADLHPKYLQQQFGMADSDAVARQVENCVSQLPDDFIFDALEPAQQQAVRHALFLPQENPAFRKVEWRLAAQMSARVNGTQAWLVRAIMEHLERLLNPWVQQQGNELVFSAARISAEEVSDIRRRLGEQAPQYAKQKKQAIASHAVDALCVLAAAAATPRTMQGLALGEGLSEDMHWLAAAMPATVTVQRVERKVRYRKGNISAQPLFKEGIYGEHFLPLWVDKTGIRVGFDPVKTLVRRGATPEDNLYSEALTVEGSNPWLLLEYLEPFLKTPNHLAEAIQADRPQRLQIDNHLAFEHLHKVAKQPVNEAALEQARALEALYYNTSKKEVWGRLYEDAGKKFKTADNVLNKKDFTLTPKFSIGRGKSAPVKLKGTLYLPALLEWQRFIDQPEIRERLGIKTALPTNSSEICERFFNTSRKKTGHGKVRRVYSLDVIDAPSGGFRIRRKIADNKTVWQMQSLDGTSASGFAVHNGQIDWRQLVQIEALRKSRNISAKEGRFSPNPQAQVFFDHWLPIEQVEALKDVQVAMAPGTKDRCFIRISQPFTQFVDWLDGALEEQPATPEELPGELKLDAANFKANHQSELLGKPRSNLFLEQVGAQVTYWYRVEGTNKAMKEAYQQAYAKSLEI